MWLCLFMFRPITLKQFNNFAAMGTLSWLGGRDVTLQTAVRDVSGSIPGFDKDSYARFLVLVLLWLSFLSQKIYLHAHPFAMLI